MKCDARSARSIASPFCFFFLNTENRPGKPTAPGRARTAPTPRDASLPRRDAEDATRDERGRDDVRRRHHGHDGHGRAVEGRARDEGPSIAHPLVRSSRVDERANELKRMFRSPIPSFARRVASPSAKREIRVVPARGFDRRYPPHRPPARPPRATIARADAIRPPIDRPPLDLIDRSDPKIRRAEGTRRRAIASTPPGRTTP